MTWYFNGEEFTEKQIGSNVGFVYEITDLETGKKYIGQKVFFNKVVRPPLKGKTRKRHSRKPSDWQEYFGSNDILKEEVLNRGAKQFRREILRLCKSKSEMNYYETYYIFVSGALLSEDYYNQWVSCKIHRKTLNSIKE